MGYIVIIEWGVWHRFERDMLRLGARALGAAVELRFLDAPVEELFVRVRQRGTEGVEMTLEQIQDFDRVIQRPDPEELALFDGPMSRG